MTTDIKLPPLPPPFKKAVYATSANTKSVRDGVEMGGYEKEPPLFDDAQMHKYARAAVEADRKRRGEPVAWPLASPEEADKGWTLDYHFIEQVERIARQHTDYTTSMEATEQVLIAANEVLRAPQPAEQQHGPDYTFTEAMKVCEEGLREWREKPHNKRWWKRIDGTPIPNDLLCCIAEALAAPPPVEQRAESLGVTYVDGVGAGRRSLSDCRDGVRYITVADTVYWPLTPEETQRLRSAECGGGEFTGPGSTSPEVAGLVEALEMMVEMVEMGGFGRDAAMDVARAALAAYRKQGGGS